jgi:hypothetical protein
MFEGQEYNGAPFNAERAAAPIGNVPTADLMHRRRNVLGAPGMSFEHDAWEDDSTIYHELERRGVNPRRRRVPGFMK